MQSDSVSRSFCNFSIFPSRLSRNFPENCCQSSVVGVRSFRKNSASLWSGAKCSQIFAAIITLTRRICPRLNRRWPLTWQALTHKNRKLGSKSLWLVDTVGEKPTIIDTSFIFGIQNPVYESTKRGSKLLPTSVLIRCRDTSIMLGLLWMIWAEANNA